MVSLSLLCFHTHTILRDMSITYDYYIFFWKADRFYINAAVLLLLDWLFIIVTVHQYYLWTKTKTKAVRNESEIIATPFH